MNTKKIYYAQLNVSEHYTIDTITNLINKLHNLGTDIYFNNETKSIDIENPEDHIEDTIREELKQWLNELPADKESINTICDNINFVYNITRIGYDDNCTIKVYLY